MPGIHCAGRRTRASSETALADPSGFPITAKSWHHLHDTLQAQAFEALPPVGSGRLPPPIDIEAALYLLVRWVFFMPTDGLRAKTYDIHSHDLSDRRGECLELQHHWRIKL
ncbi:hypothetical protein B2M20_12490 [Nitrobacter vulgaris]|uniref:Uncharacterized protein n=1 Tax=Nitrobacter vulgaris TaxID=29421 RepID=A0A1V4HWZ5_NITVU|nr:hypothetical protein B2M20_12490 [Nitrobacter vulgaris]